MAANNLNKQQQQHYRKKSQTQFNKSGSLLSEIINAENQQPQDDQVLSVRQFLPPHQASASRSNLKKPKFNKQLNGANSDHELEQDLEVMGMNLVISDKGELNLKGQKICIIPRSIYQMKFDRVQLLDIRENELVKLEEEICKNLCQLKKLDARKNKIREISPHIKAMMQLKVLRLDQNEIQSLPDEIGQLQLLTELSFSCNKVTEIPLSISKLKQLKILNMSENKIKHLPQELGELREIRHLYIHGNRFASFPCSFVNISHQLEELSLEWFMYARPAKPKLVKRNTPEGNELLQQLELLCQLLQKYSMTECALVTFLENYSERLDINCVDNRQRAPLHNAAIKEDIGVLEGLLVAKAKPNILDKDYCTPLCLAIREDNFDAAIILINADVDVNLGGGIYGSPMHLAVVKLEVWIVKELIKKKANVNRTDNEGNTPLHLLMNVFSKSPQKCGSIAELLVLNGAKVNIKNNDNYAPLHSAVKKGQEKAVQTIIRINNMLRERNLEPFDLNLPGGALQFAAVHLAAHGGYVQIVKDLIQAGADIFLRNLNGQLPRHCAKGNYILTKYIKLCEQAKMKQQYGTYHINNQYELLSTVTQKKNKNHDNNMGQDKKKSNIEAIADEYQMNYDTFMNNMAQLKVMKAFTEIDVVKKSRQISEINMNSTVVSSFQQQTLHRQQKSLSQEHSNSMQQSQTPTAKNSFNRIVINQQDMQNAMKSQVFNPQDLKPDSKFTKLNIKAEEKKINLFYLKDLIVKENSSQQEKLDALFKIKKNQFKHVFSAAMRSLLPEIDRIKDQFIQREIIQAVGNSCQYVLLQPMRDLLMRSDLDQDLIEEIEDSIKSLEVCASKPKSYSMQVNVINNSKSSLNSLMQQVKNPSSFISQKNVESPEKSRNVNSFKMKGMSSLSGNTQNMQYHPNINRNSAGTPAATTQNYQKPNFLENNQEQAGILNQSKFGHHTHQQSLKLGLTQPLNNKKVNGNQIGTTKSSTPYNGIHHDHHKFIDANFSQHIPQKEHYRVSQNGRKKIINNNKHSSNLNLNNGGFSKTLQGFQTTNKFNNQSDNLKRDQSRPQSKEISNSLEREEVISAEYDPTGSYNYNIKQSHLQRFNQNISNIGGVNKHQIGSRSHSQRSSISIPAKK
ncbi:leucine rich repeat family protein [Stylonychia lemnae]|uniref:Leucine rich repeat family protein n=1 Tax=Stylonychia lemnae TaxID=5949 RepID=A0A078A884_STYLE|nr:leucine rich repeat family protein [Stylonychia lemnae]|eukprot:CDW76991.1 leucine rich repeat family protein [Stylonychia lemnae]